MGRLRNRANRSSSSFRDNRRTRSEPPRAPVVPLRPGIEPVADTSDEPKPPPIGAPEPPPRPLRWWEIPPDER